MAQQLDGSRIAGVVVNHDTSSWTELLIRSLFHQNPGFARLTVYDNASVDDRSGMLAAAADHEAEVRQSGFDTTTAANSHGQVLARFVLDPGQADADHLLFLDADTAFTRPGVLQVLLGTLDATPDAFGVGPRMSWDGASELPEHLASNPSLYRDRLHPACALVRNTDLFRGVVRQVGLSGATQHLAGGDRFLDTFQLTTMVMRTHGLGHVVADTLVMHAFAVSYPDGSSGLLPDKVRRRDALLQHLR